MSLGETLKDYLTITERADPVTWIERHLNLRWDSTSASDAYVQLEPYQIRPIRAQYRAEVREVSIMAVEQSGKSACWRFPMIHKVLRYPGPRWVIYESDDKVQAINEEQLRPLLESVPELASQLSRFTAMRNRYHLPNGSIVDFSGAGSDITSHPKRDGVADELDSWPLSEDGIRQNLRNFKKRFRTYWSRGEGCLVKVSSPSPRKTGENQDLTRSAIAEEFDHSDKGYWHMRCLKCGKLSMPSHATYNLQWELDDEENPINIVLICPACKHRHTESQAQTMNDRGGYKNKRGDVLWDPEAEIEVWNDHVGCQWGSLACQRAASWTDIAEAQLASGKSADMYAQADFDNSWRGIPFKPKRKSPVGVKTLKKHCAPYPDPSILTNIFFSADTQDSGWYWVVRGVDADNSLYLLNYGFVRTPQELEAVWDTPVFDILPVMGLIDEGGHGDMPKYVRELVENKQGLYAYKGTSAHQGTRWKHGKEKKTILASAKQYQADLLYYIYSQESTESNYWYLPPEDELTDDYMNQVASLQPQNRKQRGNEYENWDVPNKGTADHYFDCEKQLLVILDVAYRELPERQWRSMPTNLRRGTKRKPKRQAPEMEMI